MAKKPKSRKIKSVNNILDIINKTNSSTIITCPLCGEKMIFKGASLYSDCICGFRSVKSENPFYNQNVLGYFNGPIPTVKGYFPIPLDKDRYILINDKVFNKTVTIADKAGMGKVSKRLRRLCGVTNGYYGNVVGSYPCKAPDYAEKATVYEVSFGDETIYVMAANSKNEYAGRADGIHYVSNRVFQLFNIKDPRTSNQAFVFDITVASKVGMFKGHGVKYEQLSFPVFNIEDREMMVDMILIDPKKELHLKGDSFFFGIGDIKHAHKGSLDIQKIMVHLRSDLSKGMGSYIYQKINQEVTDLLSIFPKDITVNNLIDFIQKEVGDYPRLQFNLEAIKAGERKLFYDVVAGAAHEVLRKVNQLTGSVSLDHRTKPTLHVNGVTLYPKLDMGEYINGEDPIWEDIQRYMSIPSLNIEDSEYIFAIPNKYWDQMGTDKDYCQVVAFRTPTAVGEFVKGVAVKNGGEYHHKLLNTSSPICICSGRNLESFFKILGGGDQDDAITIISDPYIVECAESHSLVDIKTIEPENTDENFIRYSRHMDNSTNFTGYCSVIAGFPWGISEIVLMAEGALMIASDAENLEKYYPNTSSWNDTILLKAMASLPLSTFVDWKNANTRGKVEVIDNSGAIHTIAPEVLSNYFFKGIRYFPAWMAPNVAYNNKMTQGSKTYWMNREDNKQIFSSKSKSLNNSDLGFRRELFVLRHLKSTNRNFPKLKVDGKFRNISTYTDIFAGYYVNVSKIHNAAENYIKAWLHYVRHSLIGEMITNSFKGETSNLDTLNSSVSFCFQPEKIEYNYSECRCRNISISNYRTTLNVFSSEHKEIHSVSLGKGSLNILMSKPEIRQAKYLNNNFSPLITNDNLIISTQRREGHIIGAVAYMMGMLYGSRDLSKAHTDWAKKEALDSIKLKYNCLKQVILPGENNYIDAIKLYERFNSMIEHLYSRCLRGELTSKRELIVTILKNWDIFSDWLLYCLRNKNGYSKECARALNLDANLSQYMEATFSVDSTETMNYVRERLATLLYREAKTLSESHPKTNHTGYDNPEYGWLVGLNDTPYYDVFPSLEASKQVISFEGDIKDNPISGFNVSPIKTHIMNLFNDIESVFYALRLVGVQSDEILEKAIWFFSQDSTSYMKDLFELAQRKISNKAK